MPVSEEDQQFLQDERRVEAKGAELKKELRLGDLVLSQIIYIAGISWLGPAARLGSSHIMYWIPAVMLFYIPSGIVVVHLNREMPLEGGLYQWAKLRFGNGVGFLTALNLWMAMVLLVPANVAQVADALTYIGGPAGAWIGETKWFTPALGALLIVVWMAVGLRGLALGKWLHNTGGLVLLIVFAGMLALAVPRWLHGGSAVAPVAFSIPAVSLLNLNILGKMSFGAFCGLDGNSVFAGECRDPNVARTLRRSVFVSGPIIALFFIVGTACVLTFTAPSAVDLISPPMQMFSKGEGTLRIAGFIAPLAAVLIGVSLVGATSFSNNVAVRLPMVAGWDHLLPAWFSRLHPRYKTPAGSILFIGATAFILLVLGSLGVGAQEAFQMTFSAALICWSLTYVVMFSIPLLARGERASWGVRLASASGLAMTLLYSVLSIFPVIDVSNAASFTMKVGGIVLGVNVAGALYFWRADKRIKALAAVGA